MKTNEKSDRRPDQKEKKFRAAIRYYPVAFRWKLIQELAAELITEQQACEKYSITVILIRRWRREYYERKIQPLLTAQPMKRKQDQTEKIKALENQLKQTQKALQDERIKSRAYEIMIEVAEQELNIPVRKKLGPGRTADAAVSQVNREFPLAGIEYICRLFAVPLGDSHETHSIRLTDELANNTYRRVWFWKKCAGLRQSNLNWAPRKYIYLSNPFLLNTASKWAVTSYMTCYVPIICYPKENEEDRVLRSPNIVSISIPTWSRT